MNKLKWFLWDMRPLDFRFRREWISTYRFFAPSGKWLAFTGALTLASPMMNTILHWKHRNTHLYIDPEWLRTQHCQLVKTDSLESEKP